MGFFSSLWNGVKKVAKAVATTAAVVVSAPIWVPVLAADAVGLIDLDGKKNNKKVADTSKNIGNTVSINDAHSARQVQDIASLVRQYLNTYEGDAESTERKCKEYVQKCFDGLAEELKQNEKIAKSFGIENIQRKKNRLCDSIDGVVVDRIRFNLSIDNSECREILKLNAGAEKERRMKAFVDRTISDAKKDLADKISRTMKQVTNDISEFLEDNLESQESNALRMKEKFDRWEVDMRNKNFDREQAQLPALEKLFALQQIEKILMSESWR